MEILDVLEERIDQLLARIKDLETQNNGLRKDLEAERGARDAAVTRIDNLLKKIQGEII